MHQHNNDIQYQIKFIGQIINLFTSHLNYQTMCLVSLHQQIKHIFIYIETKIQIFLSFQFKLEVAPSKPRQSNKPPPRLDTYSFQCSGAALEQSNKHNQILFIGCSLILIGEIHWLV
jgi:hypothetical protein